MQRLPLLLLVPILTAIAVWLFTTPEPRYITAMFWSLAALASTIMVGGGSPARWRGPILLIGSCLSLLPPSGYGIWYRDRHPNMSLVQAIIRANLKIPPEGAWFQPIGGHAGLTTYTTRSGLALNVPDRGCWDAPLPCTPNPAPNLRLRREGRLEGGFVVDGPWQMEHWPYSWREGFLNAWRQGRPAPPPSPIP